MCPAAQIRRSDPEKATVHPIQSERIDGCISSRKATPSTVPAGIRTFCAVLPHRSKLTDNS